MLHINIGYECGDALHCNMSKKCKYRAKWYKFHNISINIHKFFASQLHIKLPYLLHINQKWERLSGTKKCPYHKSRRYSCHDCKYVCGELLEECSCDSRINTPYKERLPDIETEDGGERCAYFEKCEWADDYKLREKFN